MLSRLTNSFTFLLLFIFLTTNTVLGNNLQSKILMSSAGDEVLISNSFVQLKFCPAKGGKCTSFKFRDNDEELINSNNKFSGMFIDHWSRYPWPSGLMYLPYKYELIGDGKNTLGIRLWLTIPPEGGGKGDVDKKISLKKRTPPTLAGLVLEKTVILNSNDDTVEVDMVLKNPTNKSRSAGLYIQNNFNMSGSLYNDVWYMPSPRGVSLRIMPKARNQKPAGHEIEKNPTAGWMGVNDKLTGRGMLFIFDYNYLRRLYTCGSSAEWVMENVPIKPNGEFKTTYLIKPVKGFEEFDYASANLVADIIADEVDGRVRIFNDLISVRKQLEDVNVDLSLMNWKTKKVFATFKQNIKQLFCNKKERQVFSFIPKNLADGIVIKVKVSGKGFSDCYEYYYAGDKEEYDRRHNYFAGEAALPAAIGESYYCQPPKKIKKIEKPNFASIDNRSSDNKTYKILVGFGLYTEKLKLDDALLKCKPSGVGEMDFTWANCPPGGAEFFPATYEELFSYDVVVLSNVCSKTLGDIRIEQICDYVEHGGNLLVTGGFYAFGNGEFKDSRFLDILPVKLNGPFDLKWAGKGKSWVLQKPEKSMAVEGLSLSDSPKAYWCHFVQPKKGSQVLLTADDRPMIVLGKFGKGRVAVSMLTPMGNPQPGETPWWEWKGWDLCVRKIFDWFNE